MAEAATTPTRPLSVIVFARRPRPGRVKRRLARVVGARRAAMLYAATLARTLTEAERLRGVRRVLMVDAPRDVAWFRRRYRRRGWRVAAQVHGDLGRRMARALAQETAHGRAALLIGSDLLDVTAGDLVAAGRALNAGAAVVLGPATDGGYWLVGLTAAQPELFRAVPWGTPAVLELSLAALARAGVEPVLVARRSDLDRARDLVGHRATRGLQRRRACSRSKRAT